MEMDSFSLSIKGYYNSHEIFREEAVKFIKTKVAERTGIPSSDFGSAFSGEWQPMSATEPLIKEFSGEVTLSHVLDQRLGYKWDARIEVVSVGEYDEIPCERFAGQIQLVVFE